MKKLPKIKVLRNENGFTREEMAEELQISKYTYKAYELGYREVNLTILKKLSKVFKCTTDELLKEEVTYK